MTAVRKLNEAMSGLLGQAWARSLVQSLANEAARALAEQGFALDASGLTTPLHRTGGAEQSLDVSAFVLDSLTGEDYQFKATLLAIGAVRSAGWVTLKLQIERYRPKRFELPLACLVVASSDACTPLLDRSDYVWAYDDHVRTAVVLDPQAQRACAERFAQALTTTLGQ